MTLDWLTNPAWLLVNALVAFRLTRLVVDDKVPPLPRLRKLLETWGERRFEVAMFEARDDDSRDKVVIAAQDEAKELARRISANATRVVGPREAKVRDRQALTEGTHPLVYLVDCYWCAGFWISVATVAGASLLPATAWALIAAPLALSAIVGLAARLSS